MKPDKRTPVQAWVVILSLSAVTLITFSVLLLLGLLKLPPTDLISPPDDTFVLYSLTAFNFVAFSVFAFILARNLLRLRRERQERRLGSHLKTKLVQYFIVISILPLIFLAMFSYLFINRTMEKWFGEPYRNIVEQSRKFAEEYTKDELRDLHSTVKAVKRRAEAALSSGSLRALEDLLSAEMENPKLRALEVVGSPLPEPLAHVKEADGLPSVTTETLAEARASILARKAFDQPLVGKDGQMFFVVGLPFDSVTGGITALYQMPRDFVELAATITREQEAYEALYRKQGWTQRVSLQVLGVITFLLLFAATWTAMYLAKGITEPIRALAEATEQVARGDFSSQVECAAEHELAMLVDSFNKMIADLRESRRQIEESARELQQINVTLDERRRYIETVIGSLSTGVLSLDIAGRLTTLNRAALRILQLKAPPAENSPIADVFRPLLGEQNFAVVSELIRKSLRTGFATGEIELPTAAGTTHLVVAASALRDSAGVAHGAVVMFEDVTELVKAQRHAVWSEVARRMAHEIKNPLTPIQLSAERIAKNLHRSPLSSADERYTKIVEECTSMIVSEVRTLQRMVDEFTRFARLPEARLTEGSINETVAATVKLYTERPDDIVVEADLDLNVPPVRFDAEQIKQALVNLIDNAIKALETVTGEKRVTVRTEYVRERDLVCLTVADTGHGINSEDKEKLFTPYFSTREHGTGLGLAIVSRIVAEHNGNVRVEDNHPRGAKFIIELPAVEVKQAVSTGSKPSEA